MSAPLIQFGNGELLRTLLLAGGYPEFAEERSFELDPKAFEEAWEELGVQHPELALDERAARAAYRCLAKPKPLPRSSGQGAPQARAVHLPEAWKEWESRHRLGHRVWRTLVIAWAIAVLFLLAVIAAKAEPDPQSRRNFLLAASAARLDPGGQVDAPIIFLSNGGTQLAVIPAGKVILNCSTNMSCTWNSGTRQFDMTATSTAGTAWSSLTAPTVNLSMAHGAFTTTFTYNAATGAGVDLFNILDTTGNTGTGHLFAVNTVGTSAAKPIRFTAGGTANGVEMSTAGLLAAIGSGGINATQCNSLTCMSNPMTTFGDIIYGASAGAATRLPPGNVGQVLLSNGSGSAPSWSDPLISNNQTAASTAAWTSATALNTTLSLTITNYSTVGVSFNVSGSITAGAITFEVSDDSGTTWYPSLAVRSDGTGSEGIYTLTGANRLWQSHVAGFTTFRVRLSTVITGTGTANIRVQGQAGTSDVAPQVFQASGANLHVNVDSAPTTTVTGTVTANQGTPTNWATNVAQFGGTNVVTGTGASGLGIPRVTISNDSSLAANQSVNVAQIAGATTTTLAAGEQKIGIEGLAASGAAKSGNPVQVGGVFNTTQPTVTTGQAVEAQATARGALIVATGVDSVTVAQATAANFNARTDDTGATGAAVPARAGYIAGNGSGNLTGIVVCDNYKPISITANTQIVTGAASKQTYICSINLVVGAADNVALVEGTGTTCATGTAGMAGGATAATGWNFVANGGLAQGTGLGAIMRTATAADNVCLLVSGSAQVSGHITWTQF